MAGDIIGEWVPGAIPCFVESTGVRPADKAKPARTSVTATPAMRNAVLARIGNSFVRFAIPFSFLVAVLFVFMDAFPLVDFFASRSPWPRLNPAGRGSGGARGETPN